jgi:nickel-type superoxide dismutase maturation protease
VLGLGAAAARLVVRVEVEGQSMVPTLLPGDRLLVVRGVRGVRGVGIVPLRVGSIVALPDPRSPSLLLVKRVHAIDGDRLDVRGDDPLHSTDSRTFGTVPLRSTLGRVVWRYAPPSRAGRVGGRPPTVGPGGAAVGAAGGPEGGAEGGGR